MFTKICLMAFLLQAPNCHFLRVNAIIKKAMHVGNANFYFIAKNLTVLTYFLLKVQSKRVVRFS